VPDDGLLFAERLLALLDATRYSATYKLATLLALIDVVAEHTGPNGSGPAEVDARVVALRVIELYWPQTAPYGAIERGRSNVLAQAPRNDIPAKLAAWRDRHGLDARSSLEDARLVDPSGWAVFESELIAIVIGMPLAKLQKFGEGRTSVEDRFIYDFSWPEEVGRSAVQKDTFDSSLRLRDGVGDWLVRLAPLVRPLVHAKWSQRVAAQNPGLVDSERLNEFLFGAQRVSLDRVRSPLAESQNGMCFYCESRMLRNIAVDHFLPWSRFPDNTLDNLVAAHQTCNNAKSASLAAVNHLERWLSRSEPGPEAESLNAVEESTQWSRRKDRVLSSARATYLWLPQGTKLWQEGTTYDEADVGVIRKLFSLAS
jgi:hypothetical protein